MKLDKIISFLLIFVILIAVITGITPSADFLNTSAKISNKHIVIIDAGHGGLTNTIKV